MTDKPTVVVLGATGLFGGLLVERLIRQGRFDVVCAGRTESTLKAFCKQKGVRYRAFDRDNASQVQAVLDEINPFAVVDCAGPFQYYGDDPYRFARQVIKAGSHYLDIADASDFVTGFGELDALASEKGVVAISGASSTPAISAAVVDELTRDMTRIVSIDNAIIPGNRARRTLSVMKAVLGQVGQFHAIRRHGKAERVRGWSETVSLDLEVPGKAEVKNRLASQVNTADLALFPERYGAETVTFRAGLEIKLFHRALIAGRWLVSSGLIRSLAPFAGFARWLASWFEQIGSDAGGMQVSVLGKTEAGPYVRRIWDLVADDGRGPEIPTLPVSILLDKLADGEVRPGARPSPGEVSLSEVEASLDLIEAKTNLRSNEVVPVFKAVLKGQYDQLPAPIRELHNGFGQTVYEGMAETKGPTSLLGRVAALLVGFPVSAEETPVRVTITADEAGETWLREFDGKPFRSRITIDDRGYAQERFGPLTMRLGLELKGGKLYYPVLRGRVFGWLPFPPFLLPQSIAHEEVDEEGRFFFDVLLKFRFGGRIAHYRGWLVRRDP